MGPSDTQLALGLIRVTPVQWRTQEFFSWGGSTNSVEDRGQRERGSGDVAPKSGVLEAAVIWYKKFRFI